MPKVYGADKNAPCTTDINTPLIDNRLLDPDLWRFAHRAVPVAEILPDFRSEQGYLLKETASRLAKTTQIRLKPNLLIQID
jgi:hypothetical protein